MSHGDVPATPPAHVRHLERMLDALETKVSFLESKQTSDIMAVLHLLGGIAKDVSAIVKHFDIKVTP